MLVPIVTMRGSGIRTKALGFLTRTSPWNQREEFHAYSGDHLLAQGMSYKNGAKVLWGETQARNLLITVKSPWSTLYGVHVSLSPPQMTGLAPGTVCRSCFSPGTLSIYGSKQQVLALDSVMYFIMPACIPPPGVLAGSLPPGLRLTRAHYA